MNAAEIVTELKALGSESYKRILMNHGIVEPVWGVSVAAMKKIQKRVKKDYRLALDLYDTGVYDAMYLAGLIADDAQMTKKDLQRWIDRATSGALCEYTVAWVTAGSQHGWEMAMKWIESKKSGVAAAGWATLTSLVAIKRDEELDLPALKQLLNRVERSIQEQTDCVRYAMNSFVIALGIYVKSLTEAAIKAGEKIGVVEVDVGDTCCKVPHAPDYIRKAQKLGKIGKKRKTAKC